MHRTLGCSALGCSLFHSANSKRTNHLGVGPSCKQESSRTEYRWARVPAGTRHMGMCEWQAHPSRSLSFVSVRMAVAIASCAAMRRLWTCDARHTRHQHVALKGGGHVRGVSGEGSNFAHTPCREDAEQLVDVAGFQEVRLTPPGRFHPARLAQAEKAPGERRAFAFLAFFVDPFGRPLCPRHDLSSARNMYPDTNQ